MTEPRIDAVKLGRRDLDVIAGLLGRQFAEIETMLREADADLTAFADFLVSHWEKCQPTRSSECTWRSNAAPTSRGIPEAGGRPTVQITLRSG